MTTEDKYGFTHGRIEVKAKVPRGIGVWPAIWTLGTNYKSKNKVPWPDCGEIDIMEFVGYNPKTILANVMTADYRPSNGKTRGSKFILEKPAFEDFHVYALEWYPDRLDFYVDEDKYFTVSKKGEGFGEWPFDLPQYLLINLAIGGALGGQHGIDDSIFPVEYRIDYVRIYDLK